MSPVDVPNVAMPKTVWEAMEQYTPICENNRFAMLRTAIERYAVAGWGGPCPKNNQKACIESQNFLRRLPITRLQSLSAAVEEGFNLLELNNNGKKKYRSYIKHFLHFCEERWSLSKIATLKYDNRNSKNLDKENIYRLQAIDGNPRIHQVSTTGVKRGKPYALGTQSSHFAIVNTSNTNTQTSIYYLALKCASHIEGVVFIFLFKHVLGNLKLSHELDELAIYISNLKASDDIMLKILGMLGYLHQVQGVPLHLLSLTTLIPYIKQIYSESDFEDNPCFEIGKDGLLKYPIQAEQQLSSAEALAKRKIQQKAKELIQWVDEFLYWLNSRQKELGNQKGAAIEYQRFYIGSIIYVAKFIYKLETKSKTYDDIEIVTKLREKSNSLKSNTKEQKNRIAARCLTWDEAALVVEMQRKYADTRYGVPHIKPYGLYPNKRRVTAIASDIQSLIILLLMMLVPCDRQQTYRRLEFRESLKLDEQVEGAFILLGCFQDNIFIPRVKMENPREAEWWLAIYDFKTINEYGPFWYPIPDHKFIDGKLFYEYLEMWFFGLVDVEGKWDEYYDSPHEKWQGYLDNDGCRYGWRDALKPNHNFAFSKPRTKKAHDKDSLCSLVKGIFVEFTPRLQLGKIVPVTPHSFRTMLATYTEGKLTPLEEISMAYCEHHSVEKRRSTYTITENMRKIAAAIEAMDRINQKLFLDCVKTNFEISEAYRDLLIIIGGSSLRDIPSSILEVLDSYKGNADPNRFSMLRTAIERYAVAGWGGPIPAKGKHSDSSSQEFLKNLSIANLLTIESAIKRGCEYSDVSSRVRDKNLSYARRFLEYCKQEGWLIDLSVNRLGADIAKTTKYIYQLLKFKSKLIEIPSTRVNSTPAIGLGTKTTDYVVCPHTEQQLLGNKRLHEELIEFEKYLNSLSYSATVLYKIKQLLGYLHRVKKLPLSELRLTTIIPYVKLIYLEEDLIGDPDFIKSEEGLQKYPDKIEHKLSMLERVAQRRSRVIAQELSIFLDEYFKWHDQIRCRLGAKDGLANSTKQDFLNALIHLAKHLYQHESRSNTFSDIAVIEKLKDQRSKYKPNKRMQQARVGSRCITWEETIQVVEMQRELADIRHYIELLPNQTTRKFRLRPKKSTAVAGDIQKAILLMLMTVIPCDRQQTYRRLEFREFLEIDQQTDGAFILLGDFLNQDFIPKSKMHHPEQAKWWLALYEFKTFEKYGPFWYPLPNQSFIDGKTLYEYLEMWFFGLEDLEGKWPKYYKGNHEKWQGYIDPKGRKCGWRMALRPRCNSAFFGSTSGLPFIKETFGQLIQNIFLRFTPELRQESISVTPHSFRTMFATYTSDKLTLAEEESIAYCEHHSVSMRRENYVLFDNMRQISEAVKVMERINNHVFNEILQNDYNDLL